MPTKPTHYFNGIDVDSGDEAHLLKGVKCRILTAKGLDSKFWVELIVSRDVLQSKLLPATEGTGVRTSTIVDQYFIPAQAMTPQEQASLTRVYGQLTYVFLAYECELAKL